MSVESFKNFVKDKPSLINYVESGKKSWQDFYNLYSLYGEKEDVWKKYLEEGASEVAGATLGTVTFKDLFEQFKNVDVSSIRDSLNSLQKGINYISDLAKEKESSIPKAVSNHTRPMYRYFDD